MEWWVLLHVATAFWFVAGLAGRDFSMTRASRATDIASVQAITGVAGVFDRFFVVPGSIAVLFAGLIAMVATDTTLGDQASELLLPGAEVVRLGDDVGRHEPDIVPVERIFRARITEADPKLHRAPLA